MYDPARLLQMFVAVAFLLTATTAISGDAARGKRVFSKCAGCHQIGEGAKNKVGPHLNGVFDRKAGSVDGFPYSKSMRRAASGGLVWHADSLNAYIENPRVLISGTRMSFRGLKSAQDRDDVLAYLRDFSDKPSDIPEADPTAQQTDHAVDPAILAIQGDPEYGQYLSGECTTCHQVSGGDQGIPSITLWPEDIFVTAMQAYKNKTRAHPVMQLIAGRLSDEEIAALAAYFRDLED
ncbi:MAG: c-type cytochrome [Marinosulfonomonas sp.]|nr:c-type cytochrome [Marinosulfonomonas sp.]